MKKRVVIVGGGITGLALVHALGKPKEQGDGMDVVLIEASPRLGGNIETVHHNGFVLDTGPDSWVATKPHATALAREVGLGDEIIGSRPDTRKVYIVSKRALHPMPEGLVLGIPTELRPFVRTELLSWEAKLRAGLEPLVPRRRFVGDEDESIATFVGRRLGGDITDLVVGPLLGGIFAGDAESLSVRACTPQLVAAEEKYGSLILAMRAERKARKQKVGESQGASTFLTLKRGLGDLIVNVAHRLSEAEIRTSCKALSVAKLERDPRGRWAIETSRGTLFADHVALTLPAHAAADLVSRVDRVLADALREIVYVSTATIFLGYRAHDIRHPLDAFGFLVPRTENRPILAGTFVSSKWEHRAPGGQHLLRVFVGGAGNEALASRDDQELERIARQELRELVGIERAPSFVKVFRFRNASPQPYVGHLRRIRSILEGASAHAGLYVGGNGYVGTGIPDAIKQGQEIAERIRDAETLLSSPA